MANILAVDDDEDLCTLLKRALERDGHQVTVLKAVVKSGNSICGGQTVLSWM